MLESFSPLTYYCYMWRVCIHILVHTYWRTALYIRESNSFSLFMRTNGYTSLARFASFRRKWALKNTTSSIWYYSSFFILYEPTCAPLFPPPYTYVFWKSRFVGRICSLMNLELTFLSLRFRVLLFVHFNLLKFLTLYVSWKLNSLSKNSLKMNPRRTFHINSGNLFFLRIFNIYVNTSVWRIIIFFRKMIALQLTI